MKLTLKESSTLNEGALNYGYHKRQQQEDVPVGEGGSIEKADDEISKAEAELEDAYKYTEEAAKVIEPPKREFGHKVDNAYTKVGGSLDESLFKEAMTLDESLF